jgi:uncharacterized membrane protein
MKDTENMPEEFSQEKENNLEIQSLIKEFKKKAGFKDVPDSEIADFLNRGIEISNEEQQYFYEGFLPHPSIVEEYEKLYPGVTKILIDNFIDESTHRRDLEKEMVHCEISNTLKGMNYAMIVVFITVAGACVSAYLGSTVIGSIIGIGGLATLVHSFIQGKKAK